MYLFYKLFYFIGEIRLELIRQFLKMQYDVSDSTFDQILKTYPIIKHRSLKNIIKTLDIIENQLNFPKDRIMSHGYLIGVNPENIEKLISEVKEIGNVDIEQILYKYPLLIKTNCESILKMKQIFKVTFIFHHVLLIIHNLLTQLSF